MVGFVHAQCSCREAEISHHESINLLSPSGLKITLTHDLFFQKFSLCTWVWLSNNSQRNNAANPLQDNLTRHWPIQCHVMFQPLELFPCMFHLSYC